MFRKRKSIDNIDNTLCCLKRQRLLLINTQSLMDLPYEVVTDCITPYLHHKDIRMLSYTNKQMRDCILTQPKLLRYVLNWDALKEYIHNLNFRTMLIERGVSLSIGSLVNAERSELIEGIFGNTHVHLDLQIDKNNGNAELTIIIGDVYPLTIKTTPSSNGDSGNFCCYSFDWEFGEAHMSIFFNTCCDYDEENPGPTIMLDFDDNFRSYTYMFNHNEIKPYEDLDDEGIKTHITSTNSIIDMSWYVESDDDDNDDDDNEMIEDNDNDIELL